MSERKLVLVCKHAPLVLELVKAVENLAEAKQNEAEMDFASDSAPGGSIKVLVENDRSKRIINYRLKTDVKDSPTKRLISMKGIHLKDESNSTDKIMKPLIRKQAKSGLSPSPGSREMPKRSKSVVRLGSSNSKKDVKGTSFTGHLANRSTSVKRFSPSPVSSTKGSKKDLRGNDTKYRSSKTMKCTIELKGMLKKGTSQKLKGVSQL